MVELLPASLGDWRRVALQPLADIPPVIAELGLESAAEATYAGAAPVRVRVFRMRAETSAFELIQKWRQSEGAAVYQGPYFIVANADDTNAVRDVLSRLQADLKQR